MQLEIRPLRKRDRRRAVQFAIQGMNFNRYTENRLALNLFGTYFLHQELNRASQVIAAYRGDELAGLLLADMQGEPKAGRTFWGGLYVRAANALQRVLLHGEPSDYDGANERMRAAYASEHTLDGELCFLATNPDLKARGVGTMLLAELERREPGKHIYLYTDEYCTYRFYEHRGFERVGQARIPLGPPDKGPATMACFMYAKTCGAPAARPAAGAPQSH